MSETGQIHTSTVATVAALAQAVRDTILSAFAQSRKDVEASTLTRVKSRLDPEGAVKSFANLACGPDVDRVAKFSADLTQLLDSGQMQIRKVVITARWPGEEKHQSNDDPFEIVSLPMAESVREISAFRVSVVSRSDGVLEDVVEMKKTKGTEMNDPREEFEFWATAEVYDDKSKEIDVDDRGTKMLLTVGVNKLNPDSIWRLADATLRFNGMPDESISIVCEGTDDTDFELDVALLNNDEVCQQILIVKTGVFTQQTDKPARAGHYDIEAEVVASYEVIPRRQEVPPQNTSFSISVAEA